MHSALLSRVKKVIKDSQGILEQQILRIDAIDPSGIASSETSANSIAFIKALRKDTIQHIQSQLGYIDKFEKHVSQLEELHSFLEAGVEGIPKSFPRF